MWLLGRLVGFEPTTSRTTIWRYYQLSYSRRDSTILAFAAGQFTECRRQRLHVAIQIVVFENAMPRGLA
jgi:hypothetical protein